MNFFSNSRFASVNSIPFPIISETSDSSCCFTALLPPDLCGTHGRKGGGCSLFRALRRDLHHHDPFAPAAASARDSGPRRRLSASRYFSRVRATTSAGREGPGGRLSQVRGSRKSRTYCLSKL